MTRWPRPLFTPASWLRLPRRTARLRLTGLYGCLFLAAGVGLLAVTFWLFQRDTAGTVVTSNAHFGPVIRNIACQPAPSARAPGGQVPGTQVPGTQVPGGHAPGDAPGVQVSVLPARHRPSRFPGSDAGGCYGSSSRH